MYSGSYGIPLHHIEAPTDLSQVFNDAYAHQGYSTLWLWLDLETSGLDPLQQNFGILEIAAAVTDDDLTVVDTFHIIINQPESVICGASRWCVEHFSSRVTGGNGLFDLCRASSISEANGGIMLEQFITKHAKARRPRLAAARAAPEELPKRDFFHITQLHDVIDEVNMTVVDGEATVPVENDASSHASQAQRSVRAGFTGPPRQHLYRLMLAGNSVHFDRHVLLSRFPALRRFISYKVIDLTSVLELTKRFRPDALVSLAPPAQVHRALPDVFESILLMKYIWRSLLMR